MNVPDSSLIRDSATILSIEWPAHGLTRGLHRAQIEENGANFVAKETLFAQLDIFALICRLTDGIHRDKKRKNSPVRDMKQFEIGA